MSDAMHFWFAKQLVDVLIFFGVVALIAGWFAVLWLLTTFSDWRLRRLDAMQRRAKERSNG